MTTRSRRVARRAALFAFLQGGTRHVQDEAMSSTPLKNPRWEKFCQAYVRGETGGNGAASYLAAGYRVDPKYAARNAVTMLKRPEVRARIAWLQAELAKVEEFAMARAAERLTLSKEAVLAQHGRIVIDLANVERDRMAGIVDLVVTERGEGASRVSTVRIKLGERLGALTNLG